LIKQNVRTVHTNSDMKLIFWRQNNVRPWIWTYRFSERLRNFLTLWVTANASQEGFCSMQSVTARTNIPSKLSPSKKTLSCNMQQFQPSCYLLKHCWQTQKCK
jgi:hypothetical protein